MHRRRREAVQQTGVHRVRPTRPRVIDESLISQALERRRANERRKKTGAFWKNWRECPKRTSTLPTSLRFWKSGIPGEAPNRMAGVVAHRTEKHQYLLQNILRAHIAQEEQ